MSVYFHEIPESRELTFEEDPTATTHWVCEGEFSDYEVGVMAQTIIPVTYLHPLGLLTRVGIDIKEFGHKVYYIAAFYNLDKVQSLGSYRIEFDAMGGTVHVKAGIPIATFPPTEPDHDGLIGVKGDDVEGADIVIPAMRVIVHFTHAFGYVTDARVRQLSRLAGTVDNSGFLGWQPYETLFLGAQGSQPGTGVADPSTTISYHFAMSENLINYRIGGITGISKKGWDVAWVKWREVVVGGGPSNQVEYVNIVRVYQEKNFKTLLGFG